MTKYRLIDDGYPTFKKIMNGKKWVGRVAKVTDGYLGIIKGVGEAKGATESEAFRNVAAIALGFDSPAELARHNSNVRANNAAAKAKANVALDALLRGDFEKFGDMIGLPPGPVKNATAVVAAARKTLLSND